MIWVAARHLLAPAAGVADSEYDRLYTVPPTSGGAGTVLIRLGDRLQG